MKKFSSDSKRNVFIGVCSKCGEVYEANSVVDDLEGLSFSCKKMLCTGRVELGHADAKTHMNFEQGPSSGPDNSGSRRYC